MVLNFTPFPVLSTSRMALRQLVIADAEDIHRLRSDTEVNKMVGREASKGIEDAKAFIGKITKMVGDNDGMYWAIDIKPHHHFAGTICLWNFGLNNSVEMGYELLPAHQGKGFAAEAIQEVADYVFKTIKAEIITAFTSANNIKSVKLLEKVGFKLAEKDLSNVHDDADQVLTYTLVNQG